MSSLAGENCDRLGSLYDKKTGWLLPKRVNPECDAVLKLAAPRTAALCAIASELVEEIAADMELRLSRAARVEDYTHDPLDAWASYIVRWIGYFAPSARAGSQRNGDGKPYVARAYEISEKYESFLLFVAHHVKACAGQKAAAGLVDPEECRLILPSGVAAEEDEVDGTYFFY
ncbi:hypothetical protein GGI21_005857, partial [Coemansia aciculifera]